MQLRFRNLANITTFQILNLIKNENIISKSDFFRNCPYFLIEGTFIENKNMKVISQNLTFSFLTSIYVCENASKIMKSNQYFLTFRNSKSSCENKSKNF